MRGKVPHAPSLTVAGGDEVLLFLTRGRMCCIWMLAYGGSWALGSTPRVTTAGRPSKAGTYPLDKGHVRIPGCPSFPVSVYNLWRKQREQVAAEEIQQEVPNSASPSVMREHPTVHAGLIDVLKLFLKLSGFDFMVHLNKKRKENHSSEVLTPPSTPANLG